MPFVVALILPAATAPSMCELPRAFPANRIGGIQNALSGFPRIPTWYISMPSCVIFFASAVFPAKSEINKTKASLRKLPISLWYEYILAIACMSRPL